MPLKEDSQAKGGGELMSAQPVSKRTIGGVGSAKAPSVVAAPTAPAHGDFKFNGGPVITNPVIYPTFWGSSWPDATHQAQAARLVQYLKDLISSNWMNILTQYGVGSGNGGAQVLPPSYIHTVPATLTDAQIHLTIQAAINSGTLPEPPPNNASTVLVIFLDETCAVNDSSLGIVMCEKNGDNAFGYHYDFATARGNNCYYAVIPALDDTCIKNTCPGGCSLNLTETQEQRRTQVASHEVAEMLTDPKFPSGWYGTSSDENGDICNGETATITVGPNTWNVQRIYSKTDDIKTNGASFCLATSANPIPSLPGGPVGWAVALSSAAGRHATSTGGFELFGSARTMPCGTSGKPCRIPDRGPPGVRSAGTSPAIRRLQSNKDGRLEVFARGNDGALWHIWQTAPHAGPWSAWTSLGGDITSDPEVAAERAGWLEVFARGPTMPCGTSGKRRPTRDHGPAGFHWAGGSPATRRSP